MFTYLVHGVLSCLFTMKYVQSPLYKNSGIKGSIPHCPRLTGVDHTEDGGGAKAEEWIPYPSPRPNRPITAPLVTRADNSNLTHRNMRKLRVKMPPKPSPATGTLATRQRGYVYDQQRKFTESYREHNKNGSKGGGGGAGDANDVNGDGGGISGNGEPNNNNTSADNNSNQLKRGYISRVFTFLDSDRDLAEDRFQVQFMGSNNVIRRKPSAARRKASRRRSGRKSTAARGGMMIDS